MIMDYLNDRLEFLTEKLNETRKISGTQCIGFAYDNGARDEIITLMELLKNVE